MIVEFAVRNYRSIRDEQVLSFVPTALTELADTNTQDSGVAGVGRLLASAVIYGANAAGKTSVLDALIAMRKIVLRSSDDDAAEGDIPVTPFLLDESAAQPTMFQVTFIHDGVRYQYGFEATATRVLEEWLYAFPGPRSQRLFARRYDIVSDTYDWKFGPFLKGSKTTWRDATRSNALFVTTAALLNSDQMATIRHWFRTGIVVGSRKSLNETAGMLDRPSIKAVALEIMKTADVGIVDLVAKEKPLDESSPVLAALRQVIPEMAATLLKDSKNYEISALHKTADGKGVWIDMGQESEGTRVLFAQIGPIVNAMSHGALLVFDELNNNLHPLLARAVIKLFHSPRWNITGAQLLFTTHATSLLSTEFLRRDQIWFAEKTDSGVTKIYPMTDFEPRKDASLAKHYLQGRFGAIPYISAEVWSDIPLAPDKDKDG